MFSIESSSDCFHFLLDVNPRVLVLDAESVDLKEGSFIKLLKEDDKVSEVTYCSNRKKEKLARLWIQN